MSAGQAIMDTFVALEREILKLKGEKAELLEALQMMWDSSCTNAASTPSKAAFLKARAAILKAEGAPS